MKFYRECVREDHYTLISEPDGIFLGYMTLHKLPDGAFLTPAQHCANEIISFLDKRNLTKSLSVLGCDGTNYNIGGEGGVNHFIEHKLNRTLHWFVCLLHANELPLKNLLIKLDGPTTGAKSFSGPIGKALETVNDLPVVEFKKMDDAELLSELSIDIYKKLSCDQKYLYRIVNAIIRGDVPASLSALKIGNLNHSRWLTTGSRLCRLYVSTLKPSKNLQILTSYVVKVYAPTWFRIKRNELAINGPMNLFFLMKKINLIDDVNAKLIAQECIQRNAFFAHSENILLAQLASKLQTIRTDAVQTILQIRERRNTDTIRKFIVPKINFAATVWTNIISKNLREMTEPPLTMAMSTDELKNLIEQPFTVPKYKCHTQMVERGVKEVTRVSMKADVHEKRHTMINSTLLNRAKYPKMDSRKDFITNTYSTHLPKI